jgi:hypothetical protein
VRRVTVLALAVWLTACASDPVRPDEARPSLVLKDAYFTNSIPVGGLLYRTTDQLGIRRRQFDPAVDDNLVFIVVVDPRYSVVLRGLLMRPDGVQHGSFGQELPAVASAGAWRSHTRSWSVRSLAAYPGEWHILLFLDDKPMGRYNFSLAALPASLNPGWGTDRRTGCRVWNAVPRLDETVTWSGACGPDGLATGHGVEEFRHRGGTTRYEGGLRAGKKNGAGTLVWANGNRYAGSWRDERAHGSGTYTAASGAYYEGTWDDGCFRDGSRRAAVGRPLSEC